MADGPRPSLTTPSGALPKEFHMNKPNEAATQEPVHPMIEELYGIVVPSRRTLTKEEADTVLATFSKVPDEELGFAVDSLERLAAFCHLELDNVPLASQLLDILLDTTPLLHAAGERLKEKRGDRVKDQRKKFDALTGNVDAAKSRAPAVGLKPSLNVNALRPRTKFV
jgi:hypothetical protein